MVVPKIFQDLLEEKNLLLEIRQLLVSIAGSVLIDLAVPKAVFYYHRSSIHNVQCFVVVSRVADHELVLSDLDGNVGRIHVVLLTLNLHLLFYVLVL